MPSRGYSGGRLLALGMAESLALTGTEVEFITDSYPMMMEEFHNSSKVNFIITDFSKLDNYQDQNVNHLIIVPQQGRMDLHKKWAKHGIKLKASIHLLNFESANWFNEVSPFKRDENLWNGWKEVAKACKSIISISYEGNKYAKEFYNEIPDDCVFDCIYPGINSIKADSVKISEKKKQILFVTRIDPHKGFNLLEPLMTDELAGYTIIIIVGNGRFSFIQKSRWKRRFKEKGLKLKIIHRIDSRYKFELIKESSLLYFPTKFEGFGLPPLEAAYCKTPCACGDLPVLKEFGKQAFEYANPDNVEEMRAAILRALNSQDKVNEEWQRIAKIARMNEWGKRQFSYFENN